ncbi:head maturation protease, ClpP-related [Cetobacterium sp. ZOR0034]|uniref:head maturation protease, ClpP-related n=1 Tax=Cetobacterium sp. ZOR0034 TaxID=1339239 RepID=UPI00068BF44D|nr:head maturation protease, ClpP-related [Cetobacterium sp. ZOR0034]
MSQAFSLYKTGEKKATILLYGVIGETFSEEGVSEKVLAEELLEYGEIDELTIRINSPGGLVSAGIAIYNTLKNHKAKKIVEIDGICGSIATVIAMCGEKRVMNSATMFYVHNPLTMAFGGVKELEKSIERLNQIKNDVVQIYSDVTKLDKAELEKLMDEEPYLTPEQALEKGFITEVNKTSNNGNTNMKMLTHMQDYLNYVKIKNKDTEEFMTKEQLKSQHPDVYNQIFGEGETQGQAKERERIKKLDEFSNNAVVINIENAPALIENAKYVNFKSLEEVSADILLNGKMKVQSQDVNIANQGGVDPLNLGARAQDALNLGGIQGSTQLSDDEKMAKFLKDFNEA